MNGRILCVGRRCNTVGEAVESQTPRTRVWSWDDQRYVTHGGEKSVTITWTFPDGKTESEDWPAHRDYLPTMCPRCFKPTRS